MPDWARIQVLVGAALSGGVFAHGVWGRRPALYLLAELVSGACCAALFLAYWDIRINVALGGWVIALFLYVILREGRYALTALETEASTAVSPDSLLPQWARYYIEALRGILWVVPAIYLGGLLTYRIWYPPPLADSLTHGVETADGLRAALQPVIPIGSPLAAARDSLERYGFYCLPERDAFSKGMKLTDCHKHVPATDSTLRQWMITLEHRHDSVLGFRINAYVVDRR